MIWRMMACLLFGLTLASLAMPTPASARTKHELSKRETLEQREQEKQEAETKAKELSAALELTEKDRQKLKQNLVMMTRQLQEEEQHLKHSSKDLADLERAVAKREKAMRVHDKELEVMVQAAIRLSQMPPETAWMMPEFDIETMEAASALEFMTQAIIERTRTLRVEVVALKAEKTQAETMAVGVGQQKETVLAKRKELQEMLKQKNAEASQLQAAQQEQEKRARALANEASSLKQLISSLEESLIRASSAPPSTKKKLAQAATNTGGIQGKIRSFLKAKGNIRPPSTGQLTKRFDAGGNDEHSKGVTIETASRATVSAPYDGEVVFSGDFRRYGNMVILKHTDGFHTLISGLSALGVKTGEKLLEGEPIGTMGSGDDDEKLYVELRKDNQPINPSSWFEGF